METHGKRSMDNHGFMFQSSMLLLFSEKGIFAFS